ncbi:hypothetical protein TIFTF001_028369 [Ficus carica]|uniref:Uncharacterized protein n=1 Tax=Ficus carica TaxID=3494 RepID=A0AA88DPV9_FICCA|nr:hypothetical protein TIFTF001_028369 [Ficus carica]
MGVPKAAAIRAEKAIRSVLNSSWRKGLDCLRRRNLDCSRWRGLDVCALEGTQRLMQRSGLHSRTVTRTLTEEIFSSPSSKTLSKEECDRGKLAIKIWISGADLGDGGWVGLRDEDLDFRLRRREWVITSDGVGLALYRKGLPMGVVNVERWRGGCGALGCKLEDEVEDFKCPMKTYFDDASRAYLVSEHQHHMESIRNRNPDMHRYVLQPRPADQFEYAVTNNAAQTWIVDMR